MSRTRYCIVYADGHRGEACRDLDEVSTIIRYQREHARTGWRGPVNKLHGPATGVEPVCTEFRVVYPDGSRGRWFEFVDIRRVRIAAAALGPVRSIEFR